MSLTSDEIVKTTRQESIALAVHHLMELPYGSFISHETMTSVARRDTRKDNSIIGAIRAQLVERGRWLDSVQGRGYRLPWPKELASIIRREAQKGARFHERKLELMATLGKNLDEELLEKPERIDLSYAVVAVLDKLPELRALNRGEFQRREKAIESLHSGSEEPDAEA